MAIQLGEQAKRSVRAAAELASIDTVTAGRNVAPELVALLDALRCGLEHTRRTGSEFHDDTYVAADMRMVEWAVRIGWDPEYVRRREWYYAELLPAIEGYLARARTADSPPDNSEKSSRKLPDNPDVLKLAKLIRKNTDPQRTQKEIALEFSDFNVKKANNLLRQVRRHKKTLGLADN
jgi:hypothetical protein